jgi:putative NADH-flavin reductase
VSVGTANIMAAMANAGVLRLIVQSAHGAGDSATEVFFPVRFLMRRVLLNHPFHDKDQMETLVRYRALAWTIVRPTRLTDEPATGHYRTGEHLPLGLSPSISRADVADFLLEQVNSDQYLHRAPTITK